MRPAGLIRQAIFELRDRLYRLLDESFLPGRPTVRRTSAPVDSRDRRPSDHSGRGAGMSREQIQVQWRTRSNHSR